LTDAKLSSVLRELGVGRDDERISLGNLLEPLGDRALAVLLFVFALPNVVPTPPGTSAVLGVPLVILSGQLLLGKPAWLPAFMARRSIGRNTFNRIVERAAPWLERSERLMRPRIPLLSTGLFQRLVGGICLVLAIILMLPIPLGNMLPALAICILALGVLEHDGAWILIGTAAAAVAIGVVWGVFYAALKAFVLLMAKL
jgi:hypothetical protein